MISYELIPDAFLILIFLLPLLLVANMPISCWVNSVRLPDWFPTFGG